MRSKYGSLVLFLIVIAISLNPYVEKLKKWWALEGSNLVLMTYEVIVLAGTLRAHCITKTFDTRGDTRLGTVQPGAR